MSILDDDVRHDMQVDLAREDNPPWSPSWKPPRGAVVRGPCTLAEALEQLSCGDCSRYHVTCCPDSVWSPSCCGGGGFSGDIDARLPGEPTTKDAVDNINAAYQRPPIGAPICASGGGLHVKLEDHHGRAVYTNKHMDQLRREQCLCLNCRRLTVGKFDNPGLVGEQCHKSQMLFALCKEFGVALMVTRCPDWRQKKGGADGEE